MSDEGGAMGWPIHDGPPYSSTDAMHQALARGGAVSYGSGPPLRSWEEVQEWATSRPGRPNWRCRLLGHTWRNGSIAFEFTCDECRRCGKTRPDEGMTTSGSPRS